MKLTNYQKRRIELDFKANIEGTGGTYIGINWKKKTIHYLTPHGTRDTKRFSIAGE